MLGIVESIIPIFIIAVLGYLAAVWRILKPQDIEGLSRYVFSLALPLLLFDSLASAELPQSFDWRFLLAFYGVSFLIFGLGTLVSRKWFRLEPAEQAVFGLGACYSNLVLVGLPIIATGLGEEALLPLLALVSLQNVLLFPLVIIFAHPREPGRKIPIRLLKSIQQVAANPLMAGLALGFLFRLFSLQLPQLVGDPVHLIGQSGLPCALIVLGASFHKYQIGRPNFASWTMVGLKMILQPLLVWVLVFRVFQLDLVWAAVAVMAAGMPTGINAFIMAEQLQAGQKTVSASIWISTLLAILSQTALLAIFATQI